MSILIWNCQGVGNPLTVQHLEELCRLHSPGGLFLAETKNKREKVERVCRRVGFNNFITVDPIGIAGGLCFAWQEDWDVGLVEKNQNIIDVEVDLKNGSESWFFTGVYGNPDDNLRRVLWEKMERVAARRDKAWLLAGDFNDIISPEEKEGGNYRSSFSCREFRNFIDDSKLVDLGYTGHPFTWCNKRGNDDNVKLRLDRCLSNSEWRLRFVEANVFHLQPIGSDHCPLLLHPKPVERRWKRSFRFDSRWKAEEGCKRAIRSAWRNGVRGSAQFRVQSKIKTCRLSLINWQRQSKKNSGAQLKRLKEELRVVSENSPYNVTKVRELENRLREAWIEEERYWQCKSRVQWLKEGDRNTAFFHAKTIQRRRKNRVLGLEDEDGIWHQEREDIEGIMDRYFTKLFTAGGVSCVAEVVSHIPCKVSQEMNDKLIRPVEDSEIYDATFQMQPDKAPGPDGMSPAFFQASWSVIGDDVKQAVKSFFQSGYLLRSINFTNIALIPKNKCPMNMTDFRPISLCNVLYKIIAKVLANRLKGVLSDVVSESQNAFIQGRLITDNVLIAHEVMHMLKNKRQGKQHLMSLKLDVSKAYDRLEWCYLEAVLLKLGFAERLVQWIMNCVSSVSYSYILNGESKGYIHPSRGIRQGDPLSPYLFVICTEGLSAMLSNAVRNRNISGVTIWKDGPLLSHLFFADDSLIFSKASVQEARNVQGILKRYENASGQSINLQKSAIFFSNNTPSGVRERVLDVLQIEKMGGHGKYLGLPEIIGASKRQVFGYIQERVESRLKGWKEKLLSHAGKEVLLKSVASALPAYMMSCFKLPKSVCSEIRKRMAGFWWGQQDNERRIHWVAWETLTEKKRRGGLGFKELEDYNDALLAKQVWRILDDPSSLLGKVLKARYFRSTNVMKAQLGSNPSWGWRSLIRGRRVIQEGLRWRVGDGLKISVWNDAWLPNTPRLLRPRHEVVADPGLLVANLLLQNPRRWNVQLVYGLLQEDDAKTVCGIPLGRFDYEDCVVWRHTSNGRYTVSSGYELAKMIRKREDNHGNSTAETSNNEEMCKYFSKLWALKVPGKLKHFMWRCSKEVLPVQKSLSRRHIQVDPTCILCGEEEETSSHLFFKCQFAKMVWYSSALQVDSARYPVELFVDWWSHYQGRWSKKTHGDEVCSSAVYLLWGIWKARNNARFNNKKVSPSQVAAEAACLASEFTSVTVMPVGSGGSVAGSSAKWNSPIDMVVKINCDGAWLKESCRGGIGVLARDETGAVKVAKAMYVQHALNARQVEAMALREGTLLGLQEGCTHVVLESDSLEVIADIRKGGVSVDVSQISQDILSLSRQFISFDISYVPRRGNHAAHKLASYGLSRCSNVATFIVCPDWLQPIVDMDCSSS